VHGFRLLNGHDPAILDAAIAVIEFVRRRRRGILAKTAFIVRLRDPAANKQAMAKANFFIMPPFLLMNRIKPG
jgi:hypothetical protein